MEPDILDTITAADPQDAMALMLWKDRHRNPEFTVTITADDIKELQDCAAYLDVKPEVRIYRPPGRPEVPARPATATRSATPFIPAEPPRPYVLVQMVDSKTGHAFKPIENSEPNAKLRDAAEAWRKAADRASSLSAQIMAELSSGSITDGTMREAAAALIVLAQVRP